MKQTHALDNACGIIACIHSVLNNLDKVNLTEGSVLDRFHKSVLALTPEDRAKALEGNTEFQETHKSFAAQGQSNLASTQDDVKHHFISFVINAKGQLVELDGMKNGPRVVKEQSEDLLKDAVSIIQQRLEQGEISESMSILTLNTNPDDE